MPLVNVDVDANTLSVAVKLNPGESLGEPYEAKLDVLKNDKKVVTYALPVVNEKKGSDITLPGTDVHYLTIENLKKIFTPDKKLIDENVIGYRILVKKDEVKNDPAPIFVDATPEKMVMASISESGDDDDNGGGVIWEPGS